MYIVRFYFVRLGTIMLSTVDRTYVQWSNILSMVDSTYEQRSNVLSTVDSTYVQWSNMLSEVGPIDST